MLKIEWLKLKRYKPFWVLMTLYPLCLFGLLFLVAGSIDGLMAKTQKVQAIENLTAFRFPEVWTTVTWTASWFHFLPCVLILFTVCSEFENRTHRQNLLDGWTRFQFFMSKVLVTLGVTATSVFWVALLAVLLGATHKSPPSLDGSRTLLYFLEQCLVYNFFALSLGFLLRRGILSLAVFLIYSVSLEYIVFGFFSFWIKHLDFYAPLRVANQLLPFPLWSEAARKLSPGAPTVEVLHALAAGYLILFVGVTWWRYRRSDL
jgi:ABC-2 type transport system permease protein